MNLSLFSLENNFLASGFFSPHRLLAPAWLASLRRRCSLLDTGYPASPVRSHLRCTAQKTHLQEISEITLDLKTRVHNRLLSRRLLSLSRMSWSRSGHGPAVGGERGSNVKRYPDSLGQDERFCERNKSSNKTLKPIIIWIMKQ
jgi:hypothetical protein